MGSPIPYTKRSLPLGGVPIAFPGPSTWISEQDVIQLAKGTGGQGEGKAAA